MHMDIEEVEGLLLEKEKKLDEHIREERAIVRLCSHSIKETQKGNLDEARKLAQDARKKMDLLPRLPCRGRHMEQEYAEAIAFIAVVDGQNILGHKEIGVGPEAYLLGLLDCIGEIKRVVFESLRHGDRAKAEAYFTKMEEIYEGVGRLHFSSALVSELRRKQDVMRMQVEDARGKLIK